MVTRIIVQKTTVMGGLEKGLVFSLTVQVHKKVAQFFKGSEWNTQSIDQTEPLTITGNLSLKDELAFFRYDPKGFGFGEKRGVVLSGKDRLYHRLVRPCTDHIGFGPLSEQY